MNKNNSYESQLIKDFETSASPEYAYALSLYYDSIGKDNDIVAIQVTKKESFDFPEITHIETAKVMVSYYIEGVLYYEDVSGLKLESELLKDIEVRMLDFEEVVLKKLEDQIQLEFFTGKMSFELMSQAYSHIQKAKS